MISEAIIEYNALTQRMFTHVDVTEFDSVRKIIRDKIYIVIADQTDLVRRPLKEHYNL